MSSTKNNYLRSLKYTFIAGTVLGAQLALAAAPTDWNSVETNSIGLFFPGQSSYQWLKSKDHKRANKQVAKGEACTSCHEGEEADMGAAIVGGGKLEPHPIEGKSGLINLDLKVAYDDTNVYFNAKWKTDNDYPGTAHPHWQYNDGNWKQLGWPQLHKKVWQDKQPAIYEDRFSMMIDDGSVEGFAEHGCWISCHSGMRDMEDVTPGADVKAHAQLGKEGLKKKDVRKYLPASRTDDNSSWNTLQTDEKIAELKEQGQFVDLMQWRAHRSRTINMADDGYVFEYRLTDAGKNVFSKNWDKKLKQPKYMYDKAKVGFTSRTLDAIRDQSQPSSLIEGENTVAYDPKADWKAGDLIPEYYVTKKASGSAADNSMVTSNWSNGYWTLNWERKLDTGHPLDDKILKEGKSYTFGFAVHDDNITTRGHQVSFPITIGFGTEADIQAQKVK